MFAVCILRCGAGVQFSGAFVLPDRYGKAFETEPTLHSGINNVVLLMVAGHEFDTSIELRKTGR